MRCFHQKQDTVRRWSQSLSAPMGQLSVLSRCRTILSYRYVYRTVSTETDQLCLFVFVVVFCGNFISQRGVHHQLISHLAVLSQI